MAGMGVLCERGRVSDHCIKPRDRSLPVPAFIFRRAPAAQFIDDGDDPLVVQLEHAGEHLSRVAGRPWQGGAVL